MENTANDEEFIEIHPDRGESEPKLPDYVDAYVTDVEPRACGPLVKRLSAQLKLSVGSIDLSHLRRVKKTQLNGEDEVDPGKEEESVSPQKKRQKTNGSKVRLQIVLGAVSVLDDILDSDDCGNESTAEILGKKYGLTNVERTKVPGRVPDSETEWKDFQKHWPTSFFPNKFKEFLQSKLVLSTAEIEQMRRGMDAAIHDANESAVSSDDESPVGTVIMNPLSGEIVGKGAPERLLQQTACAGRSNPLATSLVYAIQSVSRRERECATEQGMKNPSFQKGQYICTGYDVYTTHEPPVFEAMASVHSRIRRMIIGLPCRQVDNKQNSGLVEMKVHCLPGTNHKDRACMCRPNSGLARRCTELQQLGRATTKETP